MKYVIILALLAYSCTPQFHINKAKKHTKKAIDMGAVLKPSIDSLLIYDTIVVRRKFIVNDTVYIETIKTIEKVVYQVGEIRYITKKDKRKEARQVKVDSRRNFKLDKSKQKTKRVESRVKKRTFPYWIIILILVAIILLFVYEKKRQSN